MDQNRLYTGINNSLFKSSKCKIRNTAPSPPPPPQFSTHRPEKPTFSYLKNNALFFYAVRRIRIRRIQIIFWDPDPKTLEAGSGSESKRFGSATLLL